MPPSRSKPRASSQTKKRTGAPPLSPVHEGLGNAIRRLRLEQDITQEDLAHLSGLHPAYVGHIETGRRNPTLMNLLRIADGLSVELWELMQLAESPPAKRGLKQHDSRARTRTQASTDHAG
jgi:transcriptional regulator with XRE-family HTH domain